MQNKQLPNTDNHLFKFNRNAEFCTPHKVNFYLIFICNYTISVARKKTRKKKKNHLTHRLHILCIYNTLIFTKKQFIIFYSKLSIKESSSSLHFPCILSTKKDSIFSKPFSFNFSLKSFWFLLRSFWLHLSIFVKTIAKSTHSSTKHFIISKSIFCGGILPSTKRNVFFKNFLLLKNSWLKSNHCFFSLFQTFAYQYHGKSTNIQELFIIKKLKSLVFHGILEHFAKFFLWVNILIRDDFHTFERPKKANSGKSKFGHRLIFGTLFTNSADVIFINVMTKIKYMNIYIINRK